MVQFMHSGNEFLMSKCKHTPPPSTRADGYLQVPWSRERDHFRRLVRHDGWYVDKSGNYKNGDLAFWTEWESATLARRVSTDKDFFKAHFVHKILCPSAVSGTASCCGKNATESVPGFLNTDPCVFGDTFKYSNCHQPPSGDLRRMKQGSLVVFGSYKKDKSRNKDVFCLDTVLVVGGVAFDYTTNDVKIVPCSEHYKNLTLRRLPPGGNFTFYRGVTCRQKVNFENALFSFTPARLFNEGNDASCQRCVLSDIETLNQHLNVKVFKRGRNINFKAGVVDSSSIKSVWSEIVRQVIQQEFVLGVRFDWPGINVNKVKA